MTPLVQKRAAIAGALLVAAVFLVANARMIVLAVGSQPACVVQDSAMPARRAC